MRRYWLFISISVWLLTASVALVCLTESIHGPAFYIAEGIVALCLLLLYLFYVRLVRPLNSIARGIDLIYADDLSSSLRPVGHHEADRILFMFNDMMARLKDEELRLREQNHFLDLLVDSSPMGIVILGHDGRIRRANKAAVKFLGTPPGRNMVGCRIGDLGGPLAEALSALPDGVEETVRLGDARIYHCSRMHFMDKGLAHPFLLIDHLTQEVVNAEKRAYGKVIRMMSHEVNNSMGGVSSILDSLRRAATDRDTAEALDVCLSRCRAMSTFITAYADIVKIPDAKLTSVCLNRFVGESVSILESLCIPFGVRLRFVPADRPVEVMLDQVLMEQVLINMVKNSVESIGGDGEIEISVTGLPKGFIVADNGRGISPGTQQNLFTPFFSTKEDGRGLGLLLVGDVLGKHGCDFSLRTDPDGITRFSVAFPDTA
ncbi:MAG: PAS domain-containing protein [Muribaculaceae bacterium]